VPLAPLASCAGRWGVSIWNVKRSGLAELGDGVTVRWAEWLSPFSPAWPHWPCICPVLGERAPPLALAVAQRRGRPVSGAFFVWAINGPLGPPSRLALRIELPLQGQGALECDYLPGSECQGLSGLGIPAPARFFLSD
jgi:hypothetical protein